MASDSSSVQTSFLGGEWSPFVQGRTDRPDYKAAMNVCYNGLPIEEGAWVRRSGTRFAAVTYNNTPGRLIPFSFEQNTPYMMEFTGTTLRFYGVSAVAGGLSSPLPASFRLATTNDNQQVVAISSANPAVVQTNTVHGWSTGDQVQFMFSSTVTPGFTPLLRNRTFQITVVDTTHFSLTDPFTSSNIDGSTLGWSAVSAGQVAVGRILKMTTPYAAADLPLLRKVQAETAAIFLHGLYSPQVTSVGTPPTSTADFASFNALTTLTLLDGPYLDPPTDGSTLTPSGISGTITLTASAISSINGGAGFQSTDVGRHVRLFSQPALWAAGTAYTAGQTVTYNGAFYQCLANNTGQTPDTALAYWLITTSAAAWVWATISTVTNTTTISAALQPNALDTTKPQILYNTNAVTLWQLGTFSNTTGWPTCGTYYEGRVWVAGSLPNRVDASAANTLRTTYAWKKILVGSTYRFVVTAVPSLVFSPTAYDGTVGDNNGISATFNAEDVNPIFWMMGTQTGIVCGTQGGEWVIQASNQADPITPTSIQAHRVTKYGCAQIEPEHTEITLSFVHRFGRKVLEYFPDVFSGRYTAPNLSQVAKHLTTQGIAEIRYQRELAPVLWARNTDGSLIGATYKRTSLFSSQGPEFCGWHRHTLGSGRTIQSLAVGPSPDGTSDVLGMVTYDGLYYHVEILQQLMQPNSGLLAAWYVDDAMWPSGGVINTNLVTGNTLTLYGLWHLNGKTVTVWCGGVDAGDATVTNGAVTVPIDASATATFTSAYLQSISSTPYGYGSSTTPITFGTKTLYVPCAVGFTFTSQGQRLRPDAVDEIRSQTGPGLAKQRRAMQFGALLSQTQGISFGTNFSNMHAAQFRSDNGTPYAATTLYNGVYWDTLDDTSGFDSMLCWQVTRPYPAAVCSVSTFLNAQDR